MKILAIDGSTKATGIAYYIDDKLQEYQLITASSNDLIKLIYLLTLSIELIVRLIVALEISLIIKFLIISL